MDRVNQYKQRYVPFGSTGARMVRAQELEDRRRERRAEQLFRLRDDDKEENDSKEPEIEKETIENRMTRLEKWKKDRNLRKKLEAKKKKPAFKAGVPQRNLFSAKTQASPHSHCHRKKGKLCVQNQTTPVPKRITRATQRRLAAKQIALLKQEENARNNLITRANEIEKIPDKNDKSIKIKANGKSIAPIDYEFKGPAGINLPMFGRHWKPLSETMNNTNVQLIEESVPVLLSFKNEKIDVDESRCELFSTVSIKRMKIDEEVESGVTQSSVINGEIDKNMDVDKCPRELSTGSIKRLKVDEKVEFDVTHSSVMNGEIKTKDDTMIDDESTEDLNKTPRSYSPVLAQFSPFIVTSRGKSSARKEQRARLGLDNSMSDDIPTKENVMKNLNISIEEEEKTAQYYTILLQQEIERLNGVCAEWEKIQSESETPEEGQFMINQAIGQAKLLMRKKFERFRGLVLDCQTGKGEMLVRCRDLQAFWDIILMQIKDCDVRFEKLIKLKDRNWIEEHVQVVQLKKKPTAAKKKKIIAKSSARAFIEAARQKKSLANVNEKNEEEEDKKINVNSHTPMKNPSTPQKTPRSPRSLEKLIDTSFTVMKVSRMGKTPEVKLDSTITYVNSNQTPGKGILKKSEVAEKDETFHIKPTFKVNFDETISTKDDSQERINNIECSGVEKRLDFDDESFNEENHQSTDVNINLLTPQVDSATPNSNCQSERSDKITPMSSTPSNKITTSNRKRKMQKIKTQLPEILSDDNSTVNTRVLRNRTVITNSPLVRTPRSLKKNNSSVTELIKNTNNDVTKENDELQQFNNRRSTRRSVKFDVDEDCTVCAISKNILPTTPRRNKKLSIFGIDCHESIEVPPSGDLMSFDSPITPRRRNKRMNKN